VFEAIARQTGTLVDGIRAAAGEAGVPVQAASAGTMFGFYLLKEERRVIADYASAKAYADPARYGALFHALLARGVYLAPSQFEAGFLSLAHGEAEVEATLGAFRAVFSGE
jgi:glutamate-1-semialdehyde 2,1-aminomutase